MLISRELNCNRTVGCGRGLNLRQQMGTLYSWPFEGSTVEFKTEWDGEGDELLICVLVYNKESGKEVITNYTKLCLQTTG